jgi:predicted DNA-binding transcriptional regulator AlpA
MEQKHLNRLIRLADLPAYVGLQKSQIDELVKAGEFPKPVPLSDNGRAKAWLEAEVLCWQNERIAKRDAGVIGKAAEKTRRVVSRGGEAK